jgi:hypothetical protein
MEGPEGKELDCQAKLHASTRDDPCRMRDISVESECPEAG